MFIILFYIIKNINIIKNIINIKNKYYLFFYDFYLMYFCVSFHFQYCVGDSCILALTVIVTRCFINNK